MANITKYEAMAVVETKDGGKFYIPASYMETVAKQSSGFVKLGGGYVNIFEIKSIMPVDMTDVEQAIWGYDKPKRDKLMARRKELQEKLGRDFKDPVEVHRFAEGL
jgi:hypothetical protein